MSTLDDDLRYVRFLISDVDDERQVFTDDEILMIMEREVGVKIAAAALIEIIADNEVLIAKSVRTQDVTTNGPAVAQALRARAAQLRAEGIAEGADGGPVIVEFAPGGYSRPELV